MPLIVVDPVGSGGVVEPPALDPKPRVESPVARGRRCQQPIDITFHNITCKLQQKRDILETIGIGKKRHTKESKPSEILKVRLPRLTVFGRLVILIFDRQHHSARDLSRSLDSSLIFHFRMYRVTLHRAS